MNIKDCIESLPYLFEAQLTGFIWGQAGIGKTSIVKQYADKKGYHFFPFYLGTQSDLGDILGLADFVRDKNGTAVATTFATPIWLKNAIDYCNNNPDSGAIIFLDEFNRARRDILSGIFSLALDKTFHTIKLPRNCHIIAAGNPPTDDYFVTDVDETALMSRFVHIKLEPSTEEWLAYGKDKEIESTLLSFIKEQPELLEDKRESFELPVKVDRRAFLRLDKLFKLKMPEHILTQLMYGIIGVERTVAYQKHLQSVEKPLSGDEVLQLTKQNLVKLKEWSKAEDIKSSMISITCDNLYDSLKDLDKKEGNINSENVDNLITFFTTIPKEHAYNTIKKLVDNNNNIFRNLGKEPKFKKAVIPIIALARNIEVPKNYYNEEL